jgi:16S rRNA (uracil1498-N3)-methyltransferase
MPRFFIRADQIEEKDGEKIVTLKGDDAHHISYSLRMAVGEKVDVCDMQKNLYECELVSFDGSQVIAKVLNTQTVDTEPKHKIRLYQALPKSDKMETIIQKSVECGVYEIIPFFSERCIVKIDKKDENKKIERWQKIAESASKQSGRGIIPKVTNILSFEEMLKSSCENSLSIFCYEGEENLTLKQLLQSQTLPENISLIIGSEGGFSINEANKLRSHGAKCVSLGKRILRCETAPSFALACISYETEL